MTNITGNTRIAIEPNWETILYYVSVYIHILAAIFWIGGMLFTVFVLVPATRKPLLSEKRGAIFSLIGRKFSQISWILFIIILVTGITNLTGRGFALSHLFELSFWRSTFGNLLKIKLYLFGTVLLLSGYHDYYAGPKAARLMDQHPQSSETRRMRKRSSWVGRINFLLGLAILYFAIRLVR